jgi:cobalt-zinc-cadmium resistance protein CzcA
MLNKIIKFSVYKSGTVLAITLVLAIAGILSFQRLPIDAVPDITNNQVQINTTIDGLVPEEIERTITAPVEVVMRGIANVTQVRSITRIGLSQVTVIFSDDVDIYRARQLVSERLQSVISNLPKGSETNLGPVSTGLGEIYQYTLDVKNPSKDPKIRFNELVRLKILQDWFVRPQLITVSGVAEINSSGGFEKQFQVNPNILKMNNLGIHFDEILEALEKVNKNVGGGYIQQTSEQLLVQGIGLLKSIEDIKNVPIKTLSSQRVIKLKDIADVDFGKESRTGSATLNGNETVLGTVMMLVGGNSRTVSTSVNEKVLDIQKNLPKDIDLRVVYNRSVLVNETLGTVEHNLLTGAFLVIIVLFLLLGNIRAAVITAITIPLSLLMTFLIMKPLGLSGNLMSLGALDFGIIVDGTVIILDNCVRYIHNQKNKLGRKLSREEIKEAVYKAAVEVRTAAGFGELIVVIVFIPIFALVGVEGKMFRPMASTFSIAVFSALILSFTAAPALAGLILTSSENENEPRFMKFIKKLYEPSLIFFISHKVKVLFLAFASVVISIALFANRGSEFLPQLGEGSYAFHMIRPVNTSLDQSIKFQLKAEEIIKTFPQVENVFSRIGTSEIAADPMGVNISDTYIMLKGRSLWALNPEGGKYDYQKLSSAIIKKLEAELPGQNYLASQPIQMRFNELLEGTRADVAIKVFGPDLKTNMDIANQIKEVVELVKGAGDVELDLAGTSPVLQITPKSEVTTNSGVSSVDILNSVSIALAGQEAGFIYEDVKKFPIVVRLSEVDRSNLENIRNLPIGIADNITVPLSRVATMKFTETYGSINRENASRRSAVLVNLRGRDTESFVNEAQATVEKKISLPAGYYVEWGGNFKNLQEAKKRLMILTPVSMVAVLLMIYFAFGSVGQTFLIFTCVPLALVGGVLSLFISGLPFSISAGVGFIALSGIAVLNGVVLVNYFNQLKLDGMTGIQLIKTGTLIRLRPVLMTALVAIFGFIPMVISSGVGAEVQRPLAVVVIGGIISSTLLTLIVLPILYLIFENKFKGKVAH